MAPRNDLGEFLRSRRALVQPGDVGMPAGGRRRVPGLRREELALAAGVSPDHYQRIEQGRVTPSEQVLQALARILGLDDVERAHLIALANPPKRSTAGDLDTDVPPEVELLLGQVNGIPAFVLNHRRDVLAWNPLGSALITDFGARDPGDRNMHRLIFLEPVMRRLYRDWEASARASVAQLRHATGAYPDDRVLTGLVGELASRSSDFARLWPLREVRAKTSGRKRLRHPIVGDLALDYQTFQVGGAPRLELLTYLPPDSSARDALTLLAAFPKSGTVSEPSASSAKPGL